MRWDRIKILYAIESERQRAGILIAIVSIILSVFLSLSLQQRFAVDARALTNALFNNAQYFLFMFFIFAGSTISLLYLTELKSDESKGIVDTFLTHPIERGDFAFAKLLALAYPIAIATVIISIVFLIFSGEIFILGPLFSIGIIVSILVLLFCVFSIAFFGSIFVRYSPLPEMLIIFYFVGGYLFTSTMSITPATRKYVAAFFPFFTIVKLFGGINVSGVEVILMSASIFAYAILIYLSYVWMNTYKRRALG